MFKKNQMKFKPLKLWWSLVILDIVLEVSFSLFGYYKWYSVANILYYIYLGTLYITLMYGTIKFIKAQGFDKIDYYND